MAAKFYRTILFTILVGSTLIAQMANAVPSHRVTAYTTKRGIHVQTHRQTNPDHTRLNNWSTKGNVNLYTGRLRGSGVLIVYPSNCAQLPGTVFPGDAPRLDLDFIAGGV